MQWNILGVKLERGKEAKMDDWTLEQQARIGIEEAVYWHTVIIDVSLACDNLAIGTGSLVKINEKPFILTCEHVVKKHYKDEHLVFLYRTDKAMGQGDIREIQEAPLLELVKKTSRAFPKKIPVINRFYSDDAEDDLVLLELNPKTKEIKECRFFELLNTTVLAPKIDMVVYVMGSPTALARQVAKKGFGIFNYFLGSKIIKEIDCEGFDSKKHFLIDFAIDKDSVDPSGLSGAGVWTRLPSGKDRIWTPNLYLVGVQTGMLKISQFLKATKATRIFRLIK